MRDLARDTDFAAELIQLRGIGVNAARQEFERDRLIQLGLVVPIAPAIPPFATT